MKIVIPTAGFGTRLRPHTWSKPKPLVSVAGKPLLGHVLDMFNSLHTVDEVIFIVGYLGEQIQTYVSSAYPHLSTRYVEQSEMLGQSHAIWLAREGLQGPMLMVFVDTLVETDLSGLPDENAEAVAWVKAVPDPRRFGVAEVNTDGWVTRLIEKPQDVSNNLAVVGFYYFREAGDLLAAIERQMDQDKQLGGEYYLADAINIMLQGGLKMRIQTVEVWQDCGKPGPLLDTNLYLLDHGRDNSAQARSRENVVIVPPVFVDPTAKIVESVIGPHVSIGPGCTIEHSLIRESIIDAESHIADSVLANSVIGRDARVTGRFRTLNVGDSSEVGFAPYES
jgi:glucose-1-phosphate thymidylyltransferase